MLYEQHDARWIDNGNPGEGNILIFNNGVDRPDGRYSSIVEIEPPLMVNGKYFLQPGEPYGPTDFVWQYTSQNPNDFSAKSMSGSQRLPNGNTIICNGPKGYFFEVNSLNELVWDYQTSFTGLQVNAVFKIQKYGINYPGVSKLYNKPSKPILNGPSSGKINTPYTFTAISTDVENDSLFYYFDWGDGQTSDWLGPFTTGIMCQVNHTWERTGDFSIRVKAKNTHGLESEWTSLQINMQKSKLIEILIMKILHNHPILFSISNPFNLFR